MSPDKIFGILGKIAIDVPPVASARIASAILYKKEIISFGTNKNKSHPFQLQHARNPESIYWHSENAAIHSAIKRIGKDNLKYCSLYVCRMKFPSTNKVGWITGLAKPCDGCAECISNFKIKKLYYTLDNEGFACI